MRSIGIESSSILEALVNEHPDVSRGRALKSSSASSSSDGVFALSLNDKAIARSTTTATIQKIHTDITKIIARQNGEETVELPRTWVVFEQVAGGNSSNMDSDIVDSILSMHSSQASMDETVLAIMADVLQQSPGKLRQAASFTNIGGTARSAIEVQRRCFDKGVMLSIDSILSGNDIKNVVMSSVRLLIHGADHPTKPNTNEPGSLIAPLDFWGISATQCEETASTYISLDLLGRLAAVGSEPFPVRKSLALLLHATLAPLGRLRPDRDSVAVVVKNCYTGNHKSLSVELHQLGHLGSDVRHFEALLTEAKLRPGTAFSDTAELVVQYEEGNLCDWQNEPREPEDETAYIPAVFTINVYKEGQRLCLQLQSPKCLEDFAVNWLRACEASLKALAVEPDPLAAAEYWEQKLKDAPLTTFPSPSPTYQKTETLVTTISLPKPVAGPVAGQPGVRCLVQAAWAVILGRYNDSNEVLYDTLVSRLSIFGDDQATSYVLPMRVALDGKTPVSEYLQAMFQNHHDMAGFAESGIKHLSGLDLETQKSSRAPSALIIGPAQDLQDPQDQTNSPKFDSSAHPLVLKFHITGHTLDIKFIYDANSIAEIQCTALANQLEHVILQLSTFDSEPLDSVSIAGPWDLRQALKWNGPPMPAYHQCIHHLISDRAMRDPEREAIYTAETSMTYAALEEEACLLAAHIASLGIPPQTVIPICFASSKWAIVAMIGVMKAACIFMPLDPSHPESRRQGLIDQVVADTVIASSRTVAMCQRMCRNVVVLDDLFIAEKLLERKARAVPMRHCAPTDAAYILFTSGSTGVPKGVQVEHSAASSSIMNFGKKHEMTSEMRMLSFASYAFDACIYEIFVPLVFGGTVCIPPEERRLENISPFLAEARVTAALLTPSYVKTLDPDQLPTIDTLIIAGEAATLDVLHTWQSRVRLINCYGPTETCVSVMTYTYDPGYNYTASTRIGTNVHGNCWVVEPDNHNRLTPIGCTGELIVQSHAMAREYYKAPEKTAASFISHIETFPASTPMRTARCYKTGDLVKYNPDGTLEYQGRKDNQIKLRGQRLEPSEIEHVMNLADERIRSTAVHLTKRKAGNSLVAFIDFKEPLDATKTVNLAKNDLVPIFSEMEELLVSLRTYISSRLPKFMVPSFFVPLNEIPFVTSMKIDRKGLQGLADSLSIEELSKYSAIASVSDILKPAAPEELAMRDLWAKVLNADPETISRDSSFLHIGGDSISAIQLSSLARKHGLELSTAAIFQDSKLSVMAKVAKPFAIQDEDADETIKPFSILKTNNLNHMLSELRAICRLKDDEVIDDAFPCTALQEGLLALGVKHPGSYIAKFVYRLSDDIDLERFKDAWEHLCDTCENLRVRIVQIGTESIQTLVRADFAWEPTKDMSLNQFLQVAQNMNMTYGSRLSRSALIEEASGKKFFVWVTHHAVFDGWTVMLVLNALKQLYQKAGRPRFTPYSGFVKYASSMDMDKAYHYWKHQLSGAQPPTFPSRQASRVSERPSAKVTRLMKHEIPFPASTKTDITKGTILRAAWALVLARHGNTDDVSFGATASGRNANVTGISNMTGTVIGTVPVRVRIDSRKSIRDFLMDVQTQALEMVPYEQYGFQNIARISTKVKAASNVTSLLIVQPQQQVDIMENGTSGFMKTAAPDEYSVLDTMEGYFTFPIVLQCLVYSDHVIIDFTYDSSVISEQQMQGLCHHLESVVSQLLVQDDSPLGDIVMAGTWDLERACAFNSHVKEVVSETCLHDLISKHATDAPEHEAIYSTEISMTYAELERASSLLASRLVGLGVTRETVVPICFEKSIWTVIAMLGIMKSGGVFMPMDPTHPYERRAALIKQVGAQYVLTSEESASCCEGLANNVITLCSSFLDELTSPSPENIPLNSDPLSAAYILFTSGSTGQPKGIVVEHAAICSSMISHGREFGLSSSSRVLQFASYVFDVSVSEILTTLVYGGTVCVPSGTERMQDIAGFINSSRADVAMLTPSFVTTFGPQDVPNLKVLILGGEAPTKTTLSTWQPHVRLLNGYAPAECCIYAMTHTYQSVYEFPTILGKGIHTNCWIVEPENHNRLAPIGCVGELVIQGNTIGRGYVNDSAKTAQVFLDKVDWVPQQLVKPHHRYYKSGDLVKYDENGDIEYLGRKDTQVKLRGQRIELGEIEYNIQQSLRDVKYATVEVVRRGSREALIAFISFDDTDNDTCDDNFEDNTKIIRQLTPNLKGRFEGLLAHLKAKLPPFMIPGSVVALRRTPFLSSMKVNRKMLRNMVEKLSADEYLKLRLSETSSNAEKNDSPMSDMEVKLRDMWAETLGVSPEVIGRNDSFFQVGGDSISALNLASLAQKQGMLISVSKLFADPTLAAVALAATRDETPFIATLPFELLDKSTARRTIRDACQQCHIRSEREIEDIFPCTAFQEGLIALSARQPGAYVSTAVYRLATGTSVSQFRAAWERTVERCSNLRTRMVVPSGSPDGKAMQVITAFKPSWENTQGQDIASFLTASRKKYMGYGSALCRYALIEGKQPHFVLTIHHATYDLWSMHLILSVLRESYDGAEELKLLPYSNFVKYIKQADVGGTQQYWRERLDGAKPAAFPRPVHGKKEKAAMREKTSTISVKWPKNTDITRATLLQAAWSLVLARHSESDDICYGTTVTGRLASLPGITSMSGPTITTVPLRCKVDGNLSVAQFLSQIQARTTGMIPHEQYGLLNIAKLSADAKAACDFSTLLIIQPINQVAALGGTKTLLEEDTTEATTTLLEDSLQDYFDNPLIVNCLLSEEGVQLITYFDFNIVSGESLIALEHHFGRIVEQLARLDEAPIKSLSMIDKWDMDLAVNSQEIPEANNSCTHWLVEKQMDVHASRTAVIAWDGDLSYKQLGMAAAELASRIRGHGIGANDFVLVCLQRSKWSVVAMLAVQLAGAAIIPVSPLTVGRSRQAILETTKPRLILTQSSLENMFPESGRTSLLVDAVPPITFKNLGPLVPSHPTPQTLSLVLMTDSDASLNGIKFTHTAVSSSISAYSSAIGIDENTRMLQQASPDSFLHIVEVLSTLVAGGCLCIPKDHVDQSNICKIVAELDSNAAIVEPSLLEHLRPSQVPTLSLLGLNGGSASQKLLETWASAVDTHTLFGSQETLICSWNKVNVSDAARALGQPLSAAFWVVEDSDTTKLTPLGCIGELVIEGPSLGSGYLNDTASARENFIEDLSCLPGSATRRVFRTGDLVRRNFDGSFEYVGRRETGERGIGDQVDHHQAEEKLRSGLPNSMSGTVAMLSGNGEETLVGLIWYMKSQSTKTEIPVVIERTTPELDNVLLDLQTCLAQSLPGYLVPSSYLIFNSPPRQLSSGRLNRRKIISLAQQVPADKRIKLTPGTVFKAQPVTPTEHKLRDLWAKLLAIPAQEIGRGDSFLTIGGDSISAIQLVTMARAQGLGLSISAIFRDPRLCEVAASAVVSDESESEALQPFSLLPNVPSDYTLHEAKKQCGVGQAVLIEDMYPCTKLQEGLMALGTANEGSYVAHHAFCLAVDVDVDAFKIAWERAVEMTATLRTRIVPIHGTFMQVVLKDPAVWEDASGMDVQAYVAHDCKVAMGYGSKLSRYAIVASRYFVWTVHHAIADGWSINLLLERVKKIYRRSPLPATKPFASFIKYIMGSDHQASQKFWSDQLQGATRTPFPPDSVDKFKASARYSRTIRHALPADSSITMATVLRSAWSILLGGYCDTSDICFGTTISGRNAPVDGIEFLSGPTIASVPVRVIIPTEKRVGDFLREMQEQTLDMIPHEQFGLQRIAKICPEARNACEFSSLMVIQPQRFGGHAETTDVISDRLEQKSSDSADDNYYTYPLVVQFSLMDSEFEINVLYAPSQLSESRITAMTYHIEHIVAQLLDRTDRLVQDVAVSGPWDLQKAMSWNQEDQTPINKCVHHLFAKHAAQDPTREAVFTTSRTLSYGELDTLSTQLAAHLKSMGVGPESIVPICMEKSIWPTVSTMAIMKAGGAFMPMDPTHPYTYRQTLVKQANVQVVLASEASFADCENLCENVVKVTDSLHCFHLSKEDAEMALKSNQAEPHNPAYVIFSSGSTGVPKGIVVEHRSYVSSLTGHGQRLGFSRESRIFQFANHVWDVAAFDILTTLAHGGTVCVPSEYERLHSTVSFINEAKCNIALLTPGFIRTIDPDTVPTLKTLASGGEAMDKSVLKSWVDKARLFDAYGPAEASCIASIHHYTSRTESGGTIGRPVRNANWIVDPKHPGKLSPIGCEGELVIQGPAVARGYVNNPSLTKKQFSSTVGFLPDELISKSTRFYWTGDLVKYNDKGEMLYLGRRDAQVKLRGQRIELGHIEHRIEDVAPELESAVVEVIRKGTPAAALVCLMKLRSENPDSEEAQLLLPNTEALEFYVQNVRDSLGRSLPTYMIPAYFIPVSRIPKNRAAKTDRMLIREAVEGLSPDELKTYLATTGAQFCDVSNDTERLIRDAWAAALRLTAEHISTNDNFYEIGGDSITIITLLKRIQNEFGVHLGLSMMNSKSTTITQMAKLVHTNTSDEVGVDVQREISAALSAPWIKAITAPRLVSNTMLPSKASVFLTGATGFLGTQLLRGLLAKESVGRVVALVRAKSIEHGLERLKETAIIAGWWKDAYEKRIEVWTGDLEEKKLGLKGEQWAQLSGKSVSGQIDAIIHNGAIVNWNADYDKLKKANVQSALDLLQAAVESRDTPRFVFVSGGTSVDPDADPATVAEEMNSSIGYCQTKYVAETLVHHLAVSLPSSPPRFSVVKPGMIIGTATEGVANLDDLLWRIVAAAARIRLYPADSGWVPVADAGLVATRTLDQLTTTADTFVDLSAELGLPAADFWAHVNAALGEKQACKPTDWAAWRESALRDTETTGETHPLWPVQQFVGEEGGIAAEKRLSAPDKAELGRAVRANVCYLRRVGFINGSGELMQREGVLRRGMPPK